MCGHNRNAHLNTNTDTIQSDAIVYAQVRNHSWKTSVGCDEAQVKEENHGVNKINRVFRVEHFDIAYVVREEKPESKEESIKARSCK